MLKEPEDGRFRLRFVKHPSDSGQGRTSELNAEGCQFLSGRVSFPRTKSTATLGF